MNVEKGKWKQTEDGDTMTYHEVWKAMSKEDKLKYSSVDNDDQKGEIFLIRCLESKFVKGLKELSRDRLAMLKDSPFHSLLKMKEGVQDRTLIKQLASNFDYEESCLWFHGHAYNLGEKDFTTIMGIEDGDDVIMKPKHNQKHSTELIEQFCVKKKRVVLKYALKKLRMYSLKAKMRIL